MSTKSKAITQERFNALVEQGKNGLSVAFKEGKEKKTRKDLIAALAGGIQKMLEDGMKISDIVHALAKTEIINDMSEGTMRAYIMELCGKKARRKKTKKMKSASKQTATVPAAGATQ